MFTAAAHKNLMPDQPASGKIAWRLLVKAVVGVVRIYYPKDATDQEFCRDLACTILCVWRATPSRISAMLVPYEKIISQSWIERRRKAGEPLSKSGGWSRWLPWLRDRGKFLAKFAKAVRRFLSESRDDENNFGPPGDARNQKRIRCPWDTHAGFPFGRTPI
jgi:hypothetical protein